MTPRARPLDVLAPVAAAARPLIAAAVALFPVRYWEAFSRLPVRAMALPSAMATVLAGLIAGGRGFMAYATRTADAAAQAALDAAARQASGAAPAGPPIGTMAPQVISAVSAVAFALFTPAGLLASYLVLSGLLRIATVVTDDAIGDPILTALDGAWRSARARWRASAAGSRRTRAEGPETPDRLFTGESAGLPGVDYAVVASRRKPGWSEHTIVVTSDGWFRLGAPFDARLPYGLRTVYPLTRLDAPEVLRKAVQYELPRLQRGPGPLTER
jgi:hypothetical protein